MMTVQEADDCVEHEACSYKTKTYAELREIANGPNGELSFVDRTWHGTPVRLTVLVNELGLLRRRVSVEIVASAEGDGDWAWTPCVYLERFENGKLVSGGSKGSSALSMRLSGFLISLVICLFALIGAILVFRQR